MTNLEKATERRALCERMLACIDVQITSMQDGTHVPSDSKLILKWLDEDTLNKVRDFIDSFNH